MDPISDPLRDSLNPPPRYQIESDSEDEVGEGLYVMSKIRGHGNVRQTPPSFNLSGVIKEGNGRTIVGIGSAGFEFKRALLPSQESSEVTIVADGFTVGTAYTTSNGVCYIHISDRLPVNVSWSLSRWLFKTFRIIRLSIIDSYPSFLYITPRSTEHTLGVRYLRTFAVASNSQLNLSPSLKRFSPPNLLGSQPMSAAIMNVAQTMRLSTPNSLKDDVLLLLLPSPKLALPTPNILSLRVQDGLAPSSNQDELWSQDHLQEVADALLLEGISFGMGRQMRGQKAHPGRYSDSMYL